MGGIFQFYFDAATALWDMPMTHLETMATASESRPMRRAAEAAIQLKTEHMTPEGISERAAVTRLASLLANDREFTLDLATQLGARVGPTRTARQHPSARVDHNPRRARKVALGVAIAAGASLLLLDVLATAGVRVPNPIGRVIDGLSGDDSLERVPSRLAPQAPGGSSRFDAGDVDLSMDAATRPNMKRLVNRSKDANAKSKAKNPNHANGKERNQANGKERNQANGKELNDPKRDDTKHSRRDAEAGKKLRPVASSRKPDARRDTGLRTANESKRRGHHPAARRS